MALFKIFRGAESVLNTIPVHEGYVYFCEDTGNMFIDTGNNEGDRAQISAYAAQMLRSVSETDPSQVTEINIDDIFLKNMVATIEQGGTGGNTAAEARANLGVAAKGKCVIVNLTVNGWSGPGPYTQNVTAQGVTATNLIIPSPDPASWEAAGKAMVRCSNQATNSLTFTCNKKPTTTLSYSVLIQEVG